MARTESSKRRFPNFPDLTREQQFEHVERFQSDGPGSLASAAILMAQFEGLIMSESTRTLRELRPDDFEDFLQTMRCRALDALRTFDVDFARANKNCVTTYLVMALRTEIVGQWLRRKSSVRVQCNGGNEHKSVVRLNALMRQNNRESADGVGRSRFEIVEQVREEFGLTVWEAGKLDGWSQGMCALDAPVKMGDGDEAGTFQDLLQDDGASPEERAVSNEAKATIHEMFRSGLVAMSARDRSILYARFFGGFGDGATLEEIGSNHGLTRERVRQIESNGLDHLRKAFAKAGLGAEDLRVAFCA